MSGCSPSAGCCHQKWNSICTRNDEQTGTGSGLSDLELGLRLRYEIRREFAPYVGELDQEVWQYSGFCAPKVKTPTTSRSLPACASGSEEGSIDAKNNLAGRRSYPLARL